MGSTHRLEIFFFFTLLFVNEGLALTGEQSQGKKGGSTCQVEDGFV
jgi:hypothetical protein